MNLVNFWNEYHGNLNFWSTYHMYWIYNILSTISKSLRITLALSGLNIDSHDYKCGYYSFRSLSYKISTASKAIAIHRTRLCASSFNFQYPLFSLKLSSSCLRRLRRLPAIYILPSIFSSCEIMCKITVKPDRTQMAIQYSAEELQE